LVTLTDQWTGLLKTIPFALIISLIGCRQGLQHQRRPEGVGHATTSAVVYAMIGIFVCDFFMSVIFQDIFY
jgi:phospholipid/cholesterol/gamma-HCH transport system permease protein